MANALSHLWGTKAYVSYMSDATSKRKHILWSIVMLEWERQEMPLDGMEHADLACSLQPNDSYQSQLESFCV